MDPVTLILSVAGLVIAGAGTWYTYLSYRRSHEVTVGEASLVSTVSRSIGNGFGPAETLLFLLLIDQFPVGLWGASLEDSSDFYGHGDDPGSITISTISATAIAISTRSRIAEPIRKYRSYLLTRRSDHGAFGMRRTAGTPKYPEAQILEHARHTATAASFFLFFDGVEHFCVVDAVRYLLSPQARTERGLWVDHGDRSDERVDPITVAFVVSCFEEIRMALVDNPPNAYAVEVDALDQAIQLGVNYIFGTNLRTDEGLWLYRYGSSDERTRVLQNVYQYTTDVLSNVGSSCRRLGSHFDEAVEVLRHLIKVSRRYGGGIPNGPSSNVPDLDASAILAMTAGSLGEPENVQRELYISALSLCMDSVVMENSAANGWSALLSLADFQWASELKLSTEAIARVYEAAEIAMAGDEASVPSLPCLTGVPEAYVREILVRRLGVQPA